ncbi:MAG: aminopeptidase P family protein, partial [Coriobacteriales bacterium]|jgi:Xaa-Pro aminopeptidase|nr:aminopeptidase P family protein [Coriobacteriales bacterium]
VLAEKRIDAFLVTTTSDIRWLTGFSRVFDEERAHLVIVSSDALETGDGLYLHTDMRYSGVMRARPDAGVWTIFDERMGHALYAAETLKGRFVPRMQSTAWQGGEPLRIGIEGDLPLNIWRALHEAFDEQFEGSGLAYELVELENLIVGLRAVKDADEYELLRAAQSVTDAGFTHMLDYLRPGLIEREAAVELEFFMRNNGADGLAFPSILASGPNTANPHAVPGDRMLQTGDFVLLDFGAKVDDYRSDMTRTIVLGSASERQREIYEAVLRAQTEAMASLRPGVAGPEPQALADAIFADRGFGALPHGLGHGVGIDIHESPNLSLKSKDVLVEGHVVTVEPGIYVNGYGGVRIEDYGVVTAEGFEDFTASPHELIEL